METAPRYYGTKLAQVIDAQGRRRNWLAHEVGVSRSFITHIAAGRRTVDEPTALRIAATLQVPLFLLFDLSYDKISEPHGEVDAA